MHSSQGVEQGMAGGVIPPITHVQAPNEGDQPPLLSLIAHVGVGPWLRITGRAVVTRAAPPQLF